MLATLPDCLPESVAETLIAAGIVPLLGIDEALAAAEAAADIGAAQAADPPRAAARRRRPWRARATLDEWQGKRLLAEHGVPHPGGRLVANAAEAVARAETLGYPVVVKAVGAALAHKTELGAVALGSARRRASVRAAAARMAGLGEALLVEPMITDGVAELIVGVVRDPQVGLCLVLGSGGVLVELLADRALLLLPTTADAVAAALLGLKSAPLLQGFRGRPARRPRRRGRRGAGGGALRRSPCRPAGRARHQSADRPPGRHGCRGGRRPDPTGSEPHERGSPHDRAPTAILEVVLDRPKANAIDSATSRALGEAFAGFRDDPELRVAIVTGGGDKFFCAGWDLKAAADGDARPDGDYGVGGFGGLQELPDLNKPVIAARQRHGGRRRLRAGAVLRPDPAPPSMPASPCPRSTPARSPTPPRSSCRGASPTTSRWTCCSPAAGWTRPRPSAGAWSTRCCPPTACWPRAREIARLLADGPPLVFAAIKETLAPDRGPAVPGGPGPRHAKAAADRQRLYESDDQLEGARAFAEKRKPVWQGR